MEFSLKNLLLLVRETVIAPRQGARTVMNLGLSISFGWLALLLMAIGSALFTHLLLMAWLQFILLCLQVLQLVTQVLLPPLSELLGLVGLALFFWLLTNFIAELHGFGSLVKTFVAVLICLVLAAFLLAFVVALIFGSV